MHLHICARVPSHVLCTFTCAMYLHMYACIPSHVCLCTFTCVCMHLHMCARAPSHVSPCAFTCVHMYLHMCACAYVSWILVSGCLLSHSPLYCFETGPLKRPAPYLLIYSGWLVTKPQAPTVPPPQCLDYRYVQPCQIFICGCWDSRSSLHACTAGDLLTEPSPYPPGMLSPLLCLALALLVDND